MVDERPKLSQAELTRVLQNAAEIEAREGPRTFSAEDAIAAGRELGLSPGTVEAALTQHRAHSALPAVVPRPFDTRITLDAAPDRLVLHLPARGPHLGGLGKMGMGTVFAAFTAFWTTQAVRIPGAHEFWGPGESPFSVFPFFSIPFWFASAWLLGSGMHSMLVSHRLELSRDRGRLVTLPYGMTRRLHTGQVHPRLDVMQIQNRQGPPNSVPILALDHGATTYKLMAGASAAEHRWVKSDLDRWLAG